MVEGFIYKAGYAVGTAEEVACRDAVDACRRMCEAAGFVVVGVPQVSTIRTELHDAAGEFLVRVEVQRRAMTPEELGGRDDDVGAKQVP